MPVDPYIPKEPNDLIRAADWNQIQIDAREDIASHDHSGGDSGAPLHPDAIPDGSITAAKLDPDLDLGGGSVADGSITTAKLANGAVTAAKLQQPLSSLSTDELVVGGAALRSSFDEVDLVWNWQLDGTPAKLPVLDETAWDPGVGEFVDEILLSGNTDEFVRRAFRIVASAIDPALAQQLGALDTWNITASPSHKSMLARSEAEDSLEDALAIYESLLNLVYQPSPPFGLPAPGLLFAIAAQADEALLQNITTLATTQNSPQDFIQSIQQSEFDLIWQECFSALMQPIGLFTEKIVSPPALVFPSFETNAEIAMMEIEYTLTARLNGRAAFGIGSVQHAPPLACFALAFTGEPPSSNQIEPVQVRLKRTVPIVNGKARNAHLWGIATPADTAEPALLDFRASARTLARAPNWAEELTLEFDPGDL